MAYCNTEVELGTSERHAGAFRARAVAKRATLLATLDLRRAADILQAAFAAIDGSVALIDRDECGLLLVDGRLAPLAPSSDLYAVARAPLAGGPAAELVRDGRFLFATPIRFEADPVGVLACASVGRDPALVRCLAATAAAAVGELGLRGELEAKHTELLAREQQARAEAEGAQRRLAFLDQATTVLFGEPLDAGERLQTLARLAVPDLADWCWIDLLRDDGLLERAVVAHWNPARFEQAALLRGKRLSPADAISARALATGEPTLLDLRSAPPEGELLSALGARSVLSLPLRAHERTLGAMTYVFAESNRRYEANDLGLARDLAQRAALAIENAHLYEESRRAVLAREETLAVVSHDLRNPLSAILASAGVLCRKLPPGEEGERIRKRAEAIRRSAERMNHLIRDLLDMARIESKRLQLDFALHSLESIVAEAMEMFQPLATEQRIRLTARVDPGCEVLCDRERLLQVLSNLLGNALKFTAAGGSVDVRVRRLEGDVRVEVQDTGMGIDPAALPHIFDRYWQARPSGRAGAGLGLAIARGIVEAHGGRIEAESEPGRGATFWFDLPCNLPATSAARPPA